MNHEEPKAGDVIAGRYELEELIAKGGMGTVWTGADRKLGRKVALKIMRPESLEAFPDARERFEMEARAVAALRSAHVVQVHDYGVENGTPFIAMELLEGESLKQRLASKGALPVEDVSNILWQVAKGLKAAHQAGLVHRDLKPSNIFLTDRDDVEVVKLLDFGVVKTAMRREQEQTASGVLLGTPQYMSPEQARGLRKVDHRADLWSLAVSLYEALTGDNPFDSEAEAVGDIVIRVCIEPIPSPSVIKPELPAGLDGFFDTALARDPDERFQTAEALTEAFMLAAELSYAGLDERSTDGSGPGYSGPHRRLAISIGSTPPPGAIKAAAAESPSTPSPSTEAAAVSTDPPAASHDPPIIDDPSTSGAGAIMSTSIEAQRPVRQKRMIAAVAAAALVGGALIVNALRGDQRETHPGATTSSQAPPPPVPVPVASSAGVSSDAPVPSVTPSATPSTVPNTVRSVPIPVPAQSVTKDTKDPPPEDDEPQWFDDD